MKILLTDYSKPFFKDYLLPSGRLREPRKEAQRADIIIVTKAQSNTTESEMHDFENRVYSYCRSETPVFFSYLKYSEPSPLFDGIEKSEFENVMVVSGIANPINFEKYVATKWNILKRFNFPDHHEYSHSDLSSIKSRWQELSHKAPVIFTTEKDAVKLATTEFRTLLDGLPIFIISIEMTFLQNGSKFDALITDAVESKEEF